MINDVEVAWMIIDADVFNVTQYHDDVLFCVRLVPTYNCPCSNAGSLKSIPHFLSVSPCDRLKVLQYPQRNGNCLRLILNFFAVSSKANVMRGISTVFPFDSSSAVISCRVIFVIFSLELFSKLSSGDKLRTK